MGLDDGDQVGVVGRNGDGKSSLLRLLAGKITPDAGRVTVRSGVRVAMLDQTDSLRPGDTVGQSIVGNSADHEWAADRRIRGVVEGLVSDVPWDATIATLSGGQR